MTAPHEPTTTSAADGLRSGHSNGVLYPAQLPTFHRHITTGDLAQLTRWFWISEWDIAPGRSSPRDLHGRGWAVGALLQPAAVPRVLAAVLPGCAQPPRDEVRLVEVPDLDDAVRTAMETSRSPDACRRAAVAAFGAWLTQLLAAPTEDGILANRMVAAAETRPEILTVADLAAHLHVSPRSLQRLAATHVGLSPGALIRRRRLQDGARRIREEPGLSLTVLAHELGYTDHAHLTRDWRSVLGLTPTGYRRNATAAESVPASEDPTPPRESDVE